MASEVRKLAENSREAADEIIALSGKSKDATSKASQKMNELIPEIQNTSKLVKEIAASGNEQNKGAEQVNSSIQQMNNVTQQNAAASEELANSSEELAGQAEQLKDLISFFTVDTNAPDAEKAAKTNNQPARQSNSAEERQQSQENQQDGYETY